MAERPILFNAAMVRALLAGTKTQTRRVVKQQIIEDDRFIGGFKLIGPGGVEYAIGGPLASFQSPYGSPGDRLNVRETFYAWGRCETRFSAKKGRDEWHFVDMTLDAGKSYLYTAEEHPQPQPMGGKRTKGGITPTWWKRPAIFMPRAASRITLEVTGVRFERLQDISESDAEAEGAEYGFDCEGGFTLHPLGNRRHGYAHLWEEINGAGSWDANPWVWAVEFKRLEATHG